MRQFGETQIVHFGKDERVAGYSMTQLIETSLISGHFANLTNAAYLDIFSCKPYDPRAAADFAKRFFKAAGMNLQVVKRR
jgi:S-adenosylmethionine/arginine decarboxylase-like enzyme